MEEMIEKRKVGMREERGRGHANGLRMVVLSTLLHEAKEAFGIWNIFLGTFNQ